MTVRLTLIVFSLTPFALFGQPKSDSLNSRLSDEIYFMIKTVIKNEKLNINYGLTLVAEKNCNIDQDDTAYLQTLLIKPKQVDTVHWTNSTVFFRSSSIVYPDKNILTVADIENILKTKQNFTDYKWNNELLGFDLKNKRNYYSFSVPYFNLAHDKAIVMYKSHCPGLCGGGSTILLSKTDPPLLAQAYLKT